VDQPINPIKMKYLEQHAREIGEIVGRVINRPGYKEFGFALMLFSFAGPELTWISSAEREDMIKVLKEFQQRLEEGTAGTK
jgi:hypothetical protein